MSEIAEEYMNPEARAKFYKQELAQAQADAERLREFIKRYARHHGDCNIYAAKIEGAQIDGEVCKCGFEHDMSWLLTSPYSALEEAKAKVVEKYADALSLILPLAKGYVMKNPVGSNQKYIDIAESILSEHGKKGGEGKG